MILSKSSPPVHSCNGILVSAYDGDDVVVAREGVHDLDLVAPLRMESVRRPTLWTHTRFTLSTSFFAGGLSCGSAAEGVYVWSEDREKCSDSGMVMGSGSLSEAGEEVRGGLHEPPQVDGGKESTPRWDLSSSGEATLGALGATEKSNFSYN
jgi:hypothetical protein